MGKNHGKRGSKTISLNYNLIKENYFFIFFGIIKLKKTGTHSLSDPHDR